MGAVARKGLIILDRDGVLNRMLGVPNTPSHDSPMNVSQVTMFPWVAGVVRALSEAGYRLAIASNQPAAAKGKATRAELEAVHQWVVAEAEREGGKIASSHICWHRAEDLCECRKPKPGMLIHALGLYPEDAAVSAWMVGDRVVDVLAGIAAGIKTAYLSEIPVPEAFQAHDVRPTFAGRDLRDFQRLLLGER